jgi:hypothetical protein
MEKLTFQELKLVAKEHRPKIKKYYLMSKAELITRLQQTEISQEHIIEKMTLEEIQKEAKARGIPKTWSYKRAELVKMVYNL